MITRNQALKYLSIIHELRRECTLYDVHTHPFEIFHDESAYVRHRADVRLYVSDETDFVPPAVSDVMTDGDDRSRSVLRLFGRSAGTKTSLKEDFRHTGPTVFERHCALSGIDQVLLLPVVRPGDSGKRRMAEMAEMFGKDSRFMLAVSLPDSVSAPDLTAYLRRALERLDVRAVKLHPNVSGIDPASPDGWERIDAILDACSTCSIPLVIHGGMSPVLKGSPAAFYGVLENLALIDWGAGGIPVIIAHAGFYGYEAESIDPGRLSALNRLLDRHEEVRVDLSGLNVKVMSMVIKNVDAERILFGSDMLYEQQWQVAVRAICAIEQSGRPVEETFIQMAGRNPSAVFARAGQKSPSKECSSPC
jgi:predicted TIM-barrel fold metal-dependent hydrolase